MVNFFSFFASKDIYSSLCLYQDDFWCTSEKQPSKSSSSILLLFFLFCIHFHNDSDKSNYGNYLIVQAATSDSCRGKFLLFYFHFRTFEGESSSVVQLYTYTRLFCIHILDIIFLYIFSI